MARRSFTLAAFSFAAGLVSMLFKHGNFGMEMNELSVRVLADTEPLTKPDFIYLFAETKQNQSSVLIEGRAEYEKYQVPIAIAGHNNASGYPGFTAWASLLAKMEVPSHKILPISYCPIPDHPEKMQTTLSEAKGLVRFAKERNYRSVVIIAPPFHLPRCFISVVSILLGAGDYYPDFKVFCKSGIALLWNEKTIHSQGILLARRRELVNTEATSIAIYEKKGDLVPIKTALAYLNSRD